MTKRTGEEPQASHACLSTLGLQISMRGFFKHAVVKVHWQVSWGLCEQSMENKVRAQTKTLADSCQLAAKRVWGETMGLKENGEEFY